MGVFHQGLGYCASHLGHLEVAVTASRRALELEPNNQKFVNDLGWSLFESGALQEARVPLRGTASVKICRLIDRLQCAEGLSACTPSAL